MDNSAGCVISLLVIVAVGAIAAWETVSRNQERGRLFAWIAGRWNGRVTHRGWFSKPRLEINVDGVSGELTFHSSGRTRSWGDSTWTKVHFNWGTKKRLRVVPEGFTGWLRTVFGSGDIRLGQPEFDTVFWIESSDADWARQVLGLHIQGRLLKLREDRGPNPVTLDVGPYGVILKVSRLLVDRPDALEQFVDLAALILEELRGAGVAGVVLATVETKGGACPVCAYGVEKGRTCPECRTPHHEDCWKYSGGCAIFACEGRRESGRS